jgi:predicted nucleic acid-binding Zn ribbon protein
MLVQKNRMSTFTAVLQKEDDTNVAECPEAGTVRHRTTVIEAAGSLKKATGLYFEEFCKKRERNGQS